MLKESLRLTKKLPSSEELNTRHSSAIEQLKGFVIIFVMTIPNFPFPDEPNLPKMNGLMSDASIVESDSEEEEVADEEERRLTPKICVDFDSGSDFDKNEKVKTFVLLHFPDLNKKTISK